MADDRLFHRSLGHGARIEALTDFEYRVWTQYILSADDFGVMRFSFLPIQNADRALAKRPAKTVQKALEGLVTIGLVLAFDAQGQAFLCQANWQKYQKRTWTSRTMLPKPPTDLLRGFEPSTQHLFTIHPGGIKVPKYAEVPTAVLQTLSEVYPDFIQTKSEVNPATREMLTLTTNAKTNAHANPDGERDVQWEAFKAAYPPKGREQGFMALQFFLKACDDVGFDVVMAGLERYAKSKTVAGGFVTGMQKWLEKGLWIQEPEPADKSAESLRLAQDHLAKIDAERASRGR